MFDSLQQIISGRWQRFKTEGLCYGHCDNKISEDVLWNKIVIKVQTNFTVFFYVQITRENGSIPLIIACSLSTYFLTRLGTKTALEAKS